MTHSPIEADLTTAISALYRAPLEEFISVRDALAKQLRADKRKDDAALVKALRKPSRVAWTLDSIAHEDSQSIDRLASAIGEAQSGADLRAALETVKEAVRAVAAVGARVALRAGHAIEPHALAAAIHAVIGDANAFAEFRAGRLVDVPQGGGLDLLIALTASPASTRPTAPPPKTTTAAIAPAQPDPRVELAASARAEMRRAEKALAEVRRLSEHAAKSLREAEARRDAAEHALAHAQSELQARRDDVERTRLSADSAAATLEDAQRALDDARARVAESE